MFSLVQFIFFLFCIFSFGFVSLNQIIRIKSIVLLIPLSISFGIGAYIFFLQCLSFLVGPQGASVLTLFIQLLIAIAITISIIKRKKLCNIEMGISRTELAYLFSIAIIISILTFFGVYRYGTYDRESHIPMSMTMFHNNVYPPRDPFRPDYVLLYHYGGDLLAGAIYHICNFDISRSYEIVSTIMSSITFLSFFGIAWLLTKNFKLSLIAGICTYLSGGLMWADAIFRYITKNFPEGITNWSFFQTYLNLGFHGSIINPPSALAFSSTSSIGNPLLIFCFILFWKMIEENDLKRSPMYISFLAITLFTLYLTADWLHVTFWAGVMPFLILLWLKKQRRMLIPVFVLLMICGSLVKTIGNPLFLQDMVQNLGRTNIFDAGIKENLFTVVSWGRLSNYVMNYQTVSCFSWDFLCEFGLSLILFPIAIIYLIKTKNTFAILLFFSVITTMPIPVIIDFKLNPVEIVRLFAFGNTMLVLLITCGIGFLFKSFFQNKALLFIYLLSFCLSPLSQLFSAAIFTPRVFTNKILVEKINDELKKVKSFKDLKIFFSEYNMFVISLKNNLFNNYKNELEFIRKHSKSKEGAISDLFEAPSYAGLYSFIPSKRYIYWDQLYSQFGTIFQTAFSTLDPYLLDELNIKWILITKNFKNQLPKNIQEILNNTNLFKLAYVSHPQNNTSKQEIEIYYAMDLKNHKRGLEHKTAWLLINKQGQILEIASLQLNKITLFASSKDALLYLKDLYNTRAGLKKELITAQPIVINTLEEQIKNNNLKFVLDKRF